MLYALCCPSLFKAWSSRSQWDLVFVNVSQRGLALLFPLLALLSALLGKKWAMRAFGADALEVLENTPWKGLLKWCVGAWFSLGWKPMRWSRTFGIYAADPLDPQCEDEVADAFSVKKTYQRRFVFIAHVKRSKGIFDALRAFELLGAEYTFDFYGPIAEEACRKLETHPSYRGVLDPVDVPEVLTRYDGLVLPTFYQGEATQVLSSRPIRQVFSALPPNGEVCLRSWKRGKAVFCFLWVIPKPSPIASDLWTRSNLNGCAPS